MTTMNDALASLQADAAKPAKRARQNKPASKVARKPGKRKLARQNANQRNRKASRNFRLSPEALKELRADGGKGFINPYREGSSYHACAAALRKLGAGRFHSFEKIVPAIIAEMGDGVDAFKARTKRSETTGKDWKDRIIQNVKVLARSDYGAKLRQVGFEVRTDRGKGAGLFKVYK